MYHFLSLVSPPSPSAQSSHNSPQPSVCPHCYWSHPLPHTLCSRNTQPRVVARNSKLQTLIFMLPWFSNTFFLSLNQGHHRHICLTFFLIIFNSSFCNNFTHKKVGKMVQRSPQMLTSSINSVIIKIRKITLIPCYYLIYIPTSDFSDYPTDVIFGLVSNLLLYVAFSCYVSLLYCGPVFSGFLYLSWPLHFWRALASCFM